MRARRFGRWVGRAAVIAAVAIGGVVAVGSAAQADLIWERAKPTISPVVTEQPLSAG
jgi:hypothetical protein